MELLSTFFFQFLAQLQSPTFSFLLGGFLVAALSSRLAIPQSIYQFIVFVLLMKVGMKGGMEIRQADLLAMLIPAAIAVVMGCGIVGFGSWILGRLPRVTWADATATAGLFGAVSASTLAAGMVMLDDQQITFEAWVPALYPFMDIPALVLAIVLAGLGKKHPEKRGITPTKVWRVVRESLQGSALSALILGMALGWFARPEPVMQSFYEPLFRGLLSILMLVLGMEVYSRIRELLGVAHWFVIYAVVFPMVHGLVAFGLGYLAHVWFGFSPGGVILLAIIAASNSDISGPPTIRAGIPQANPSTYIGASTALGTPVAIAMGVPLFVTLGKLVFAL